jgi:hypothetical protein
MTWLDAAIEETASYPLPASLSTFEKWIDPEWIASALEITGVATLRRRRLPVEQVVWLVLGMALMRDRPIHEVVARLDLALPGRGGDGQVARSTVSQARARVGPAPLKHLFDLCSTKWAFESAGAHRWNGLSLFALDGTTLRVADSEENRAHFGSSRHGGHVDGAYPLVRVAVLVAVYSHVIAMAAFGPYRKSEYEYAAGMWDRIPGDSLTIVDRNFFSAALFLLIQRATNRHWLIRGKSNIKWTVVKKLGRDDLLVEMKISPAARKQDPSLPRTFLARAIGYKLKASRSKQWLFTSLTDFAKYPAVDMIELYHRRWEIEVAYDEVKTHLLDRKETIRSRSIAGVEQELWGILITFNLVRLEMQRIAEEAGVLPVRVSFVTAMRFIRDEWMWSALASPGSIPEKLHRMRANILAFLLPERRSDRSYPRVVKLRASKFPRKRVATRSPPKPKRAPRRA